MGGRGNTIPPPLSTPLPVGEPWSKLQGPWLLKAYLTAIFRYTALDEKINIFMIKITGGNVALVRDLAVLKHREKCVVLHEEYFLFTIKLHSNSTATSQSRNLYILYSIYLWATYICGESQKCVQIYVQIFLTNAIWGKKMLTFVSLKIKQK